MRGNREITYPELLASVLRGKEKNLYAGGCLMQTVSTVAAIAVFSIFLFPFPSPTLAQQSPAQQPSVHQPPPAEQPNVTDAELRSFAKVYVQIEKIRATYEPQVKGATSPEEGK
jgi:hypothetical protein